MTLHWDLLELSYVNKWQWDGVVYTRSKASFQKGTSLRLHCLELSDVGLNDTTSWQSLHTLDLLSLPPGDRSLIGSTMRQRWFQPSQTSFINISLSPISSKGHHQLKVNSTNPELLDLLNATYHHLLGFSFFFFSPRRRDWLSLPFLANTMLITLVYSQNISRGSLSLSHEGRGEEKSYGGRFSPSLSSQPWRAWLLTTMNMGFVINICSSGIGPRPNHPSHLLFLHKKRGNQGHHLAAGWNY